MTDWIQMFHDQEMTNEQMCKEAFVESHPYESPANAEYCDNGSWSCKNCPWQDNAPLHSKNVN